MTDDEERTAFMQAIVKLADDAELRRQFLHAYNLALHPPLMLPPAAAEFIKNMDFRPGAINFVTREDLEKLREHLRPAEE